MSPNADSGSANIVFDVWAYVYASGAFYDRGVRPSLNLTSGVRISGDGTPNAPYTLSLE